MDKIFLKNSFSMYILAFTKMVIPFLTLPYLTRVLSVDTYGVVAYIKSLMGYVQLLIDFGFMFSVTKDIADAKKSGNWQEVSFITCTATLTRFFLGLVALLFVSIIAINTEFLKNHILFTFLMFINTFLSILWMDFLFRGIEKMEILSYRFLFSKIMSTALVFTLIRSDQDLILMGAIEILGTLVASGFTFYELTKLRIEVFIPSFINCCRMLYNSFLYFFSNFATTSFGLFITLLLGFYLDAKEVAYWSLALQLVGGIQAFYSPILDALYPAMVRDFRTKLVIRVLCVVMPIIIFGCGIIYYFGVDILTLIASEKYVQSAWLLMLLIPVLIISFPAMLFGWPYLGALGKIRLVTMSSVLASIGQVIMLAVLIITNNFTLYYICITRCISEFLLFFFRFIFSIYVSKKELGRV